jgi:hypothetical protein
MAFVPVPNAVQVEVRGLYFNQKVENTIWMRAINGDMSAAVVDACSLVFDWWTESVMPSLSVDYSLREVYASDQSNQFGPTNTQTPVTVLQGGLNSAGAPGGTSLAVSFRTAGRGRSFRGRNYIVGIPKTSIAGNVVVSSYRTAIQSAYAALIGQGDAVDLTWVIASKYSNKAPRVTGVTTPVQSVVVTDPSVDSQRRRLEGRGE